jgi:hypothetical protein
VESNVQCPLCIEEVEDDYHHAFFTCSLTGSILVEQLLAFILCFITGCMELLIQLICFDIYRHEDSDVAGWVVMLICCIWHNRNDKVWNNHSVDATQLGHHAFNSWNDWYDVHKQQELREQSCATLEALQYWCMFLCGEWCYLLCVLL